MTGLLLKLSPMKGYEDLYEPVARGIIKTHTGWMNVLNPTPLMVNIYDIAHSLAHLCRFGGHTSEFYSVAQHSNHCYELCKEPELRMAMLMHDASEAYLIDVPRPVKVKLDNYKEIEDRLMTVIAEKYGFEWPLHPKVKEMDEQVLRLEWDSFMVKKNDILIAQQPSYAKQWFLRNFNTLKGL